MQYLNDAGVAIAGASETLTGSVTGANASAENQSANTLYTPFLRIGVGADTGGNGIANPDSNWEYDVSNTEVGVVTPEPSSVAAFAFTGLGVAGMLLRARKRAYVCFVIVSQEEIRPKAARAFRAEVPRAEPSPARAKILR